MTFTPTITTQRFYRLLLFVLVTLVCSLPMMAQETQVPMDTEGRVMIITAESEQTYRLFPEYPGFLEARLFQAVDSSFTLEITQTINGQTQRLRKAVTLAEVQTLRLRVSAIYQSVPTLDPEQNLSGWERTSVALAAGLFGLEYGLIADLASTPYSSRYSSVGTWTILTPLIYAGGTIWASNEPWFTRSSSQMLTNGLTLGFVHGLSLYGLVAGESQTSPGAVWGTGILAGAVEGFSTMRLPEKLGLNLGQTTVLTSLGFSGLLAGILVPATLGAFDGNGWTARGASASVLAMSVGGYWLGYRLSQSQYFAGGDGVVFSTPASLGLFLPVSVALVANSSSFDGKIIAGLSLATHVLGYVIGNSLINNKDFTFDQGRAISTATGLGTLAGLVALYGARNNESLLRASPLITILGGAIGFAIAYGAHSAEAKLNAQVRQAAQGGRSSLYSDDSWFERFAHNADVQFCPVGLLGMAAPTLIPTGLTLPILNMRYTFGQTGKQAQTDEHDE